MDGRVLSERMDELCRMEGDRTSAGGREGVRKLHSHGVVENEKGERKKGPTLFVAAKRTLSLSTSSFHFSSFSLRI